MGRVFQAWDSQQRRKLALKVLKPEMASASLAEEFRLLSRLSHPNLVGIFDYHAELSEHVDDPQLHGPCFTMELLEGRPLDRLEPATDPEQIVRILGGVASALHYLHSRNILHRDLKPSNLFWDSSRLRLLDFGLSGGAERHGAGAGTPAYLPPEAFWGEYGRAGDLFALGASIYEWLCGAPPFPTWPPPAGKAVKARPLNSSRPELPDFLGDLLARLLEISPGRRPSSALSLVHFLRRHGLEGSDGESAVALPSRLAWQSPPAVVEACGRARRGESGEKFLAIVGPSGSGRSRLLEELRWESQLGGGEWHSLTPREAATWHSRLLRRFNGKELSLTLTDSLTALLAGGRDRAVAFEDFHEWPESTLREIRLLLEMAEGRSDIPTFFFDVNSELEGPDLRAWRRQLESSAAGRSLDLPELSEAQARSLLASAPLEKPPAEAWTRGWLEQSGGRPLLLMEGLRRGLAEDFAAAAVTAASAPERLREAARRQIEGLSTPAKRLFALFLSRGRALDLAQIAALEPEENWERDLAELDRSSLLRLGPGTSSSRRLAQPSLRDFHLSALPADLLREAHRRWLRHDLAQAPPPEQAGSLALHLAEHAAAVGDAELAKTWGLAAAAYHEGREEPAAALACYRKLLPLAAGAEDRYVLHGSMAPLFHRLGRYAEAGQAYAQWSADRPDDETRLQKNKFHLFSGMVEYSAGNWDAAREHFESSLKIGPPGIHPRHHPYHARSLNFMAAIEKRAGRPEAAREHLRKALELAGEDGVLRGEIEQRWGELEQSLGRFLPAFDHLRRNRELFQKTRKPQTEAVSYQLLGLWAQDYGRLTESERLMSRSIELSKAGGAVLQAARYLQNRALLHLEMARYGEAWEEMKEAGKILRAYGNEEDLNLSRLHLAEFHSRLGNPAAAAKLLEEAANAESTSSWELLYQRGQHRRRQGALAEAEADWQAAASDQAGFAARMKLAMARLGLAAALGRLPAHSELLQATLRELSGLEGRLYPAWRRSLELWSAETERLPGLLPAFLGALGQLESPEQRRELLANSALALARRGLGQSAQILWQKQWEEGLQIAASLPEELKMEYEKNLEGSSLDEELKKIIGATQEFPPFEKGGAGGDLKASAPNPVSAPPPPPLPTRGLSEQRFRQFSEIARQIAGKTALNEVLERVMDAAIELTGAERGFLLLENPKSPAPLAGFEVKTARHFNQQSLGGEELQISMTAVRQAMDRGSTLLSANAQHDERLKDKQSVVQYQLKSILAVPLELEGRVLGAIYLDHRYAPDCFREEDIVLLDSFSAQAALAVQKARFIAELKQANSKLEEKVLSQAQRIEVLSVELAQVRDQLRYGYDEIVGGSPKMMEVFHLLDHVSDTMIPVWIYGESGTGKELVARSLHENSSRKKGPLVTINCSAIPETLLESELFGHKRGAFTHADRDRIGLFEQASGGTLFMDEVADMSLNMQVKLLRVLQENEVRPLGAAKAVKVDVRLVTASNQDLQQLVADEKFRQDLYFRINGITIPLPPLRERKEDIPLLVSHLIEKLSHSFKLGTSKLSEAAYEKLVSYSWPGNIRQLESVLRNALLFAQGGEIGPHLLNLPPEARPGVIGGRSVEESTPKSQERAEERRLIIEALRRHKMDKNAAAKDLDVTLRCLYMRMDRHGIPKNKSVLAKFLGLKN